MLNQSGHSSDPPIRSSAPRLGARHSRCADALVQYVLMVAQRLHSLVVDAGSLVIQQFLGHSDPKTTMRYIRRADELASKAYQYNTLPM